MKKTMKNFIAVLLAIGMIIPIVAIMSSAAITLVWPVPYSRKINQGYHSGCAIDIGDTSAGNAKVVSATSGTVKNVFKCTQQHAGSSMGSNGVKCDGFGTGVVIQGPDGRFYGYAHMKANSIPSNIYVGATVTAGQQIGNIGSTGNSTGNHLHFQITTGNYYTSSNINPAKETYTYGSFESDTTCPTVTDVYSSNLSDESFTINCTLNDNVGVTNVWLVIYGPSGEKQYGVPATNGVFSHTINTFEHGGKGEYTVHIYAMDAAGNSTPYFINDILAVSDTEYPVVSNAFISDISNNSFTINCTLNDNIGVTRVWLNVYGPGTSNGYAVEASNGNFSHTIYTSNYGGAGEYSVHIYAMDAAGNSTPYRINDIWAVNTYELYYNANGGTGAPSSQSGSTSYTISSTTPTRSGYTFLGWSTSSSSSYATYDAGDTINLTSSTTLYAVWEKNYDSGSKSKCGICGATFYDDEALEAHIRNHTYTLTYNANGGSGAPSSQTGSTSYTISSARPTRSGYTFLGWSKSSSATSASYVAGNTITLSANTTLYAVWQKNASSYDNIRVTIRNNPGTRTLNYGDTVRIYAEAQNLPAGAKIGWYVDDGSTISAKVSDDGTYCDITATGNGTVNLAAKAVDANGNVMTDSNGYQIADVQKINTKTSLWLRIVSFFKNLFGINRTVVQAIFKGTI